MAITLLMIATSGIAAGMTGIMYDYNKMTSSMVKKICQDKYGYIWIASEYGLNKFDGYRFVNYYHASKDSTSLQSSTITSLFCTRKGEMLIGTTVGLARYDYENDRFHRYSFPDNVMPHVNSFVELSTGDILMGTAGYGIFRMNDKGVITSLKGSGGMADDKYLFLRYLEDDKHVWCNTKDDRLCRFTVSDGKVASKRMFDIGGKKLSGFVRENSNAILVFTSSAIMRYDIRNSKMEPAEYTMPSEKIMSAVYKAKNGDIFIGTSASGIYVIHNGSKEAVYEPLYNGHYRLLDISINDIFQDKDQNIWACSPHHGVFMSNTSKKLFNTWDKAQIDGHLCHGFMSMTPAADGSIYCVARHLGVFHIDNNGATTRCAGTPHGCCSMFRDSKGRYWLGTWTNVYIYNPLTSTSTKVDGLVEKPMHTFAEDKLGNIYVSVLGEGFAVINGITREVKYYNSRTKSKGLTFDNDWVGQIFCDSEGMMWITTSNGMWCFNPGTEMFVDVTGDGTPLLKDSGSGWIAETIDGNIVIGCSRGILLYDKKKRTLSPMPNCEQLENKRLTGVVVEQGGDLWISTSKGLWQYKYKQQQLVSFLNGNGITDNEFCDGAFCKMPDGKIYFGANSSITSFYPKDFKDKRNNDMQVYLTCFSTMSKVENPFAEEYYVSWDDNRFTMEFSLLNFQNAANVAYEYRMNGGRWEPFDNGSNTITFSKLRPGSYIIEARAMINGEYSKSIKRVKVVVESPWYSSWFAIFLYVALAVTFIIYIGVSYRRRQKANMEEEKIRLLINATHDIRSPLALILGPLDKLRTLIDNSTDEASRKEMASYAKVIERSAQRVLLLVNQILDIRKIDKKQMHLKCSETDMVKLVEKSCKLFDYHARQEDYTFTFNYDKEQKCMAWIDKIHFEKVINNLLSNAFKYTDTGGEVTVSLSADDKQLTLTVTDDGIGISEEQPERLFDRFYQSHNNEKAGIPSTGVGLNLARKIVELHGGSITAANRTDGITGACFNIVLPLGKEHLKPENIDDSAEKVTAKKTKHKKYHILLVDDDEDFAAYTARELSQWYKVDVFHDGETAHRALFADNYDLVISDVMMQEVDGIALLKRIKNNPKTNHLPVILLTTKTAVEDRLRGIKCGADEYIDKPFSCDMLHARIDNLIDNVRRLRGKFSGEQQQADKLDEIKMKNYDDELMKRVMESINKHLSDSDFTVEVLAKEVGSSRVQLHRKIKERTGVSTGKFIRNLRMEQAERLIRNGAVISQVAFNVGFSDQTYFSTVFKQYFGVSPSDYGKE